MANLTRSNVNLLVSTDEKLDPIGGIPRMSNMPVANEFQHEIRAR